MDITLQVYKHEHTGCMYTTDQYTVTMCVCQPQPTHNSPRIYRNSPPPHHTHTHTHTHTHHTLTERHTHRSHGGNISSAAGRYRDVAGMTISINTITVCACLSPWSTGKASLLHCHTATALHTHLMPLSFHVSFIGLYCTHILCHCHFMCLIRLYC